MAIGRTPRELLATTTSDEITEMMAFEHIEPFGSLHDEFMAGAIAAAALSPHRKAEAAPFKASDFMPALDQAARGFPDWRPAPEVQLTPEQLAAWGDALFGF